jgi:hypothetical protein
VMLQILDIIQTSKEVRKVQCTGAPVK